MPGENKGNSNPERILPHEETKEQTEKKEEPRETREETEDSYTKQELIEQLSELRNIDSAFNFIPRIVPFSPRAYIPFTRNFETDKLPPFVKQLLLDKGFATEPGGIDGGLLWTQEGVDMSLESKRKALIEAVDEKLNPPLSAQKQTEPTEDKTPTPELRGSLGDAISSEVFDKMHEQAEANLKTKLGELRIAIEEDLKAMREEVDTFSKNLDSKEIKKNLGLLLEKIQANETPSTEDLTTYSEEYKQESGKLLKTIEKIEEPTAPLAEAEPPLETEPPATPQAPKEKKPIFVRGTVNEKIVEKVETESKEKQKEQIALATERLTDQKSKLEEILGKAGLPTSEKGKINRAIKETEELAIQAGELSESDRILNPNSIERLWARIEKNFDIISEELLVPANLPIESSPEGDRITQELEQRLQEAKEPAEKMDIDLGEKKEPKVSSPEKEKLNQLVDEAFKLYQENLSTRDSGDPKKASDDLVRESVSYLVDKAVASGILESKEAVTELKKRIAEQSNSTEDETRDNTPFDSANFPLTAEEEAHNENENRNANESFPIKSVISKELLKSKTDKEPVPLAVPAETEEEKRIMDEWEKQKSLAVEMEGLWKKSNDLLESKDDVYPNLTPEGLKIVSASNELGDTSTKISGLHGALTPDGLFEKARQQIVHLEKLMAEYTEKKPSTESEADLTSQEEELLTKVETVADVENLPEAVKEKVSSGLWSLGFAVKEKVNGFIGEKINNIAENKHKQFVDKKEADNFTTRFLFSLAESYNKDARDATQKRADIAAGGSKRIIGRSAYVGGRVLRFGRLIADAVGWTSGAALAPYTRIATAFGMLAERGLDVAKEAQLRQEKFLEQDSEKAADAAWKIYRELEDKKNGERPTTQELEQSYREKLPKDILEKLGKGREAGMYSGHDILTRIFERQIFWSTGMLEYKVGEIDKKSISAEDKEKEKQKIYNDFAIRQKDFSRVLSDTGKIDIAAMLLRSGSLAAKWLVRAVAVESVALAGETIFHKVAEALGSQTDAIHFESFELHNGINSKDGLNNKEVGKIVSIIESLKADGELESASFIKNHYAKLLEVSPGTASAGLDTAVTEAPTGLTKAEVEENITIVNKLKVSNPEAAKQMIENYADIKVEGSNLSLKEFVEHPEKLQNIKIGSTPVAEVFKPFRFENPIAGNQDSIQFSTEQSFRINPDHFGYDPAKDGPINEWAKRKATETLKELADKKFNGKLPDIVHDGDKVVVEIGTDGKAHVNFENSSGLPAGHLPEKPSIPDTAKTELRPVADTDKFEKAWHDLPPKDVQDSQHISIVRQYVLTEMAKPEYQTGDFPKLNQEKIDVYSKMFSGEWNKINNPEKLAQSLFEFDERLKQYTAMILGGKFDKVTDPATLQQLKENIFPVESRTGKLFFTQFVDEGQWQLFQQNAQGITQQLDHKKGLFGGKTQVFDTMHVRKFLRSH